MKSHSSFFRSSRVNLPALADLMPDEKTDWGTDSSAHPIHGRVEQTDTIFSGAWDVPRAAIEAANKKKFLGAGQRFGPLLYWLASLLVISGSVLGASQAASQPAIAQFSQEGSKLVGIGAVGLGEQGWAVGLSADSNTAIVGGLADNRITGAAWIYIRRNGVWTQQSRKMVGTDAVGSAAQGFSVALSDDGNTAIVGGPFDNLSAGAVWIFIRSYGVWTQQGSKLVGTDTIGNATQGVSVALSADGNTAIVGGTADNFDTGATWVFVRSRGVWSQQGNKLVGTGAVGNAAQGVSVALSADGNTAIVGGLADNGVAGAAWVFIRSGGGVWTQQGGKLVGAGAVGNAGQGSSVALSADGNTAIIGGLGDNLNTGAAWVFTRSNGVWTQQGNKLVGNGAVGNGGQGASVALSDDGDTAIVGGVQDNSYKGAAWVFTRSGSVWTQQGNKLVGTDAIGSARQGHSVALSADGKTAIVGGLGDNRVTGAAWVYTRSGGVWTTPAQLGN